MISYIISQKKSSVNQKLVFFRVFFQKSKELFDFRRKRWYNIQWIIIETEDIHADTWN